MKLVNALLLMVLICSGNALAQERPRVDPTRPPAAFLQAESGVAQDLAETVSVQRMRLQSIRYVEGAASAMINQEIYRVGDRVGGWVVQDITPTQVELQREEETLTLTVFSQGQLTISKDHS